MILEDLEKYINQGILEDTFWRITQGESGKFHVLLEHVYDAMEPNSNTLLYASPGIENSEDALELAKLFEWFKHMIYYGKTDLSTPPTYQKIIMPNDENELPF